jgi:regulator of RNase E activity RraA
MTQAPSQTELEALTEFDTPTICNALEMIESGRRSFGYTRHPMTAINATAAPVIGVVRTATMRSAFRAEADRDTLKQERLKYYEYMHRGDPGIAKVCVMQDLDGRDAGVGPFWGEFNTRIHRAIGFRAVITDGSVRDVGKLPDDVLILCDGLRPSHAHVHIATYGGQVNVFGMTVSHGDLVHADEHGAVCFPPDLAVQVAECARQFMAAEAPVIDACKADTLTLEELKRLYMAR